MPSRSVHTLVAVPVGAAFAAGRSSGTPNQVLLEMIGGALGGCLGGLCPDIFDPPTSPNHRALAHGVVPAGLGGRIGLPVLDRTQNWLRERAEELRAQRLQAASAWGALVCQLLEWLCLILAGAAAGLLAGYASHLALDFMTPRRLPLLG